MGGNSERHGKWRTAVVLPPRLGLVVAITAGNYDAPDQWRPPRRYFATCCFLHCVADDTDHCVANEVRAFTQPGINASTSASGRQVKANHDFAA